MKKIILGSLIIMIMLLTLVSGASAGKLAYADKQVKLSYQKARAQYLTAKDSYLIAKQNWITTKRKWQQFKNANETDELIERAQNYLLKGTDVMVRQLESIKKRVGNYDNLDDQEEIIAEIDNLITKTNSLKDDINSAESKADIISIGKKVKDSWMAHRRYVKKFTGMILNGRISHIINRLESVTDRLDSKVQELKAEGYDTSDAEAKISDLREKINLAKEKYDAAKEKFKEINSASDADQLFKEGHDFVKDANKYLRESYKEIKDIVKDLRTQIAEQDSNSGGDEE